MKIRLALLLAVLTTVISCRSTKYPATNETKEQYFDRQDRQVETPLERAYDRDDGLGG